MKLILSIGSIHINPQNLSKIVLISILGYNKGFEYASFANHNINLQKTVGLPTDQIGSHPLGAKQIEKAQLRAFPLIEV
jgi:hypothetical protein